MLSHTAVHESRLFELWLKGRGLKRLLGICRCCGNEISLLYYCGALPEG